METDLSLKGHNLNDSIHYLNGFLNTQNKKNNQLYFLINGSSEVMIPQYSTLLYMEVLSKKIMGPFPSINLKIITNDFPDMDFNSSGRNQKQKININLQLPKGVFSVMLSSPTPKNEVFLISIKYRAP